MVAVCKSDTQSRVNARYNKSSHNTPIYYEYQTLNGKCSGFAMKTGSSKTISTIPNNLGLSEFTVE